MAAAETDAGPVVRLVVQRCDEAALLLDNDSEWASMGWGLVVHVSFQREATAAVLPKAVKAVLTLPLLTLGLWGDGIKPQSLAALCRLYADRDRDRGSSSSDTTRTTPDDELLSRRPGPPGLMVIPAAALISSVKGSSLQYHKQAAKEQGRALYDAFLDMLASECERLAAGDAAGGKSKGKGKGKGGGGGGSDGGGDDRLAGLEHVPPADLFKQPRFADAVSPDGWADGLPTRDAAGAPLSKNASKRLAKLLAQQHKRHERFLAAGGVAGTPPATPASPNPDQDPDCNTAAATSSPQAASSLQLIKGTFGNRQGLRLTSESGPFTHVFEF